MIPGVLFKQAALDDLDDHFLFIAEKNRDTAIQFLDAVEQSLSTLVAMPEIGAPREWDNLALDGVRMWPVKSFTTRLIFYIPHRRGIEVVRILHHARNIQVEMEEPQE